MNRTDSTEGPVKLSEFFFYSIDERTIRCQAPLNFYNAEFYEPEAEQISYSSFDIFRVHIWEIFICTTTYLLHNEDYKSINELLVHTYYLRTSPLTREVKPASYEKLRFYSKVMEEQIKPHMSEKMNRLYTLTGNYLCTERVSSSFHWKTNC